MTVQSSWNDQTIMRPSWTLEALQMAKGDQKVSVVIPTLNEQERIGGVVESVSPYYGGLVDEIIVMDSASTDNTVTVARRAGATVVQLEEVLPEIPVRVGKGESLWRGVAACRGDIIVFLDGDVYEPDSRNVPWLIAPLLLSMDSLGMRDGQQLDLVKGFYRRPLGVQDDGGGRVTELVARPLLASFCSEASFLIQPLGGEYALRRSVAERVPFAAGYGVEIGLIMDVVSLWGAEHIAQVNLGVREHRNRPLRELGVMAKQVSDTALRRAGVEVTAAPLVQFHCQRDSQSAYPSFHSVEVPGVGEDRPPLVSIPSYRELHHGQCRVGGTRQRGQG